MRLVFHSLHTYHPFSFVKPHLAAAVALAASFFSWQQGSAVSSWLRWPSMLSSAAVGLFLVYNVLAGGNPPPGEKPLADAAPHSIKN